MADLPLWTMVRAHPGGVVVSCGALACVHYWEPPTVADVAQDFRVQLPLVDRFGELSQLVVFDAAHMRRIGHLAKDEAAAQLRQLGARFRCAAIVVQGDGLGARFMRATVNSALTISRTSRQQHLFGTVEAGLAWVQAFPGQHASVREASLPGLLEALAVARRGPVPADPAGAADPAARPPSR